ncbi:uncharacterized protein DUF2567 [Blastococcus xanthinilyticus]|uniref:Uncharacterized protein DUF2567 n=1 Tax=Blastococcus xanthinilyticus TaxID=1564164 RepID=A0A5S5CKN6_9ACTN|nr:uncharacterized protein DUF2567 [Blastococcus xanthinilyticus]
MPPSAYWRGWPEVREDLRTGRWLLAGLALTGIPIGLLWWLLAPRADYRVTDTGPVAIGSPQVELQMADDAVLVFLLLAFGLLAGGVGWLLRRGRGVGMLLVLALGTSFAAVVAWQVGELVGVPPTPAQLAEVGALVTTGLRLGSLPALAVAPFGALLVYVAAALMSADEGLRRPVGSSGGLPRSPEG